MSVGTIFSPLITGILLKTYGFASAYILSAILIVPIFFLIKHYYHNVNDPKYKKVSMFKGIIRIILDKNLRAVTLSMLMLQCFYSLIVIYAPLYLATFWEIPIYQYTSYILPFALIPFLIIPYETGIISDKYLGEKEMMIAGYLIMAISTLLFPFVKGGLIIFALYLFLTRIGASMLDSMNYSYFFKKVHHDDVTSIVLFNNLHLLSNILMPFLALLTIYLTGDMRYLFIIYGIIALAVLPQIFKMKDTK
jgi:MFS family permease